MENSLDKIIRTYIVNEFNYQRPERENGKSGEGSSKRNLSHSDSIPDEDYVDALHECLEKKGIMRELQAFLRQKMVLILQDKWPKLLVSPTIEFVNGSVIKLLEDFLCCRRLLYTFSVMSSELGLKSRGKVKWGKMACRDAEKLLEQMEIKKDSQLSRRILKFYSDKDDFSLLECIINTAGWSESPKGQEITCNLGKINGSLNENRSLKVGRRLKQIDEFFDEKQRQNANSSLQADADERFHAIERYLEEDKRIQLHLAIKKFKAEEMERIKEELEHKMRFEMLAKENELLLNYKEKSMLLKDNLEREKSIWYAEKSREEHEIELKRQELETMLASISKAREIMEHPESPRTKTGSESKQRATDVTDASLVKHYEKVDEFLMREAELRVAVKRLQEENNKLLVQRERQFREQSDTFRNQALTVPERPSSQNSKQNVQNQDPDAIAFLQYNLEQQAEEIKHLKQQLHLDQQKPTLSSSSPITKQPEADSSDLITFLAESKRRCEQIERQSKSVEKKLHDLRVRRSRSSSPISFKLSKLPSPGPYSTMSKMLIEQIQPLQHSQPQVIRQLAITGRPFPPPPPPLRSVPTLPLPPFEDAWSKPIIAAQAPRTLHQDQVFKNVQEEAQTLHQGTKYIESHQRLDQQSKEPTTVHSTKSTAPKTSKDHMADDTPAKPEAKKETFPERKKAKLKSSSDSERVVKAVRKGALSFEKVSSDGESSMCSSIRQDVSSRSRSRIKVQGSQGSTAVVPVAKIESEDQVRLEINTDKNVDSEHVSGDDKSMPISAVSIDFDISHNGDQKVEVEDDDFWRM